MPNISLFPDLPGDARCWIHVADTPLDADTQTVLLDHLSDFFETWTSHQRPVTGRATLRDDRVLIVAATLDDGAISGCGIDSLTHTIDDVAASKQVRWMPALHVLYRDADGHLQSVSRTTFRERVDDGHITAETPVLDPSLTTLADVRDRFEQPASASWHGRIFRIPTPA